MVGPTVDELVVGLLRAQFVERDHLVERRRLMQFARGRLGVAIVVEAAAVLGPIDLREAGPLERLVDLLAGRDVDHVDLLPIAAGFGAGVGQEAAVVRSG